MFDEKKPKLRPDREAVPLSLRYLLSQAVYKMKNTTLDYDDVKLLSQFIWELFAGWSFIDEYREDDIVAVMIKAI